MSKLYEALLQSELDRSAGTYTEAAAGEQVDSSGQAPVTLRDLVGPMFRYHRLLLTSFVAIFVLTMVVIARRPKEYRAQMTVLLSHERVDPVVTTEATRENTGGYSPVTEEEINSEAELLKSQDVLQKVVLANGLQNAKPGRFSSAPESEAVRIDGAVQRLGAQLQIKVVPKSNVVDVSYSSADPKLTYSVLNSLGEFYVQKDVAVHRTPGTYEFFDAETKRYQGAVDQSEAHLRDFDKAQGSAAPDLQLAGMATQVTDAIGQRYTAEQAIAADENRIRTDEQALQSTSSRSAAAHSTSPPSMLLQQLGVDLLKAESKRTELALKYNPDYPLVQEADQEIAQARQAFDKAQSTLYVSDTTDRDTTYELLRQDLAKTQADLAAQKGSLAALRQSIGQMQSSIIGMDTASITEKALQRDIKVNEDNYLLYLSKREQEKNSDALDKLRVGNVSIAVPPAIPVLPVAAKVPGFLAALGIAALISLILTYVRAYLDPTFRLTKEVSDLLGVPVVIPISKRAA